MLLCRLARSMIVVLLLSVEVPSAAGQAGPPCGPDLPIKCTPGKDAAIVLGFVGGGILAAYLGYRLDHPRHETAILGCVVQSDKIKTLQEDNTQTLYVLTRGVKKVKAGQRVILRGKKTRDASGTDVFQVRKLVEDQGPCETQTPIAGRKSP